MAGLTILVHSGTSVGLLACLGAHTSAEQQQGWEELGLGEIVVLVERTEN